MWNFLLAVAVIIFAFILYLKRKFRYWEVRNIPHEKSKIIVGNLSDVIFGRKHLADTYDAIYNNHKDFKYCGIMNFGSPAVLLRNPELIQQIMSKENEKYHKCCDESNELAKDRRWKRAKAKITPQLSPLKVKNMFYLLQETSDKLVIYLKNCSDGNGCELDTMYLTSKFASDVISNCILGLECDCFKDSTFGQLGLEIFAYNSYTVVLTVITLLFPKISYIKTPKNLSERLTSNMKDSIISTIKRRIEDKIRKQDFLSAIVEFKLLTKDFDFDLEYVTFKSLGLFLEGFETCILTLQCILYELAINKSIQDKIFNHLKIMLLRNGKLDFDALREVKYLDMVIYETLRKYPSLPFLAKECEDLILPPAKLGCPELTVPKGMKIIIPILSVHNDASYFEKPDEFIPERFSENSNYSKKLDAFIGFPNGPHMCLGHRFALTQLKLALFAIVTNFEIQPTESAVNSTIFEPMRFIHEPKGSWRLKFVERTNNKF